MEEEKFSYDLPGLLDFEFGTFAAGATERVKDDTKGDPEEISDFDD